MSLQDWPRTSRRLRNACPVWLRDPVGRMLMRFGRSLAALGVWLRESDP
ncbi:hypothetical protein BHAOGJBA_1723 [Methylobacterium hispanicum]|uniref:Uncharacterized protein n=1 Tax=Methylobacterium hispanicum TaxID=270350 RepID=A0AAV4ZJK4_9HYPH|nr:hypothetical protein BHAOGJBA_1723 [Methylobacterium hispanicum]